MKTSELLTQLATLEASGFRCKHQVDWGDPESEEQTQMYLELYDPADEAFGLHAVPIWLEQPVEGLLRWMVTGWLVDCLEAQGYRRVVRPTVDDDTREPVYMVGAQSPNGWIEGHARYAATELEALLAACLSVGEGA